MREILFSFPLAHGLHARPASHLEAAAGGFRSAVSLLNRRTGAEADARSVLALLSTDTRMDDPCALRIDGPDADAACDALSEFVRERLPRCDDAPAGLPSPSGGGPEPLPRALRAVGVERGRRGVGASPGATIGPLVVVGGLSLSADFANEAQSPEREFAIYVAAVAALEAEFAREIAAAHGVTAEILRAHQAILRDPALRVAVKARLSADGGTAGQALFAAAAQFGETLRRGANARLAERALDLEDVAGRLLVELYGEAAITRVPALARASIVAAENLTPGQFLALDRRHLSGLVLGHAGTTSHTVILARSFGVPTLTGVEGVTGLAADGEVILDAGRGLLIADVSPEVRRYYELELRTLRRRREALQAYRDEPGATADRVPVPLLANVASAAEVASAVEAGAEGVGLFRTEMLYMDRASAPSEEQQFEIFSEAARAANGRPVVIRTFDIGGDKPVPYLQLAAEANPFLGFRGARLYGSFADLLRTQIRAILRASVHGNLKIMAPMIACPEEMRAFRAAVEAAREELRTESRPDGAAVPVGMMLEVPSAVFALPELAGVADFFSLGTNDLAQYFLAADRDNDRLAELYSWTHPAFLRLLRQAVEGAHAGGRPIGVCGEMADRPDAQPLLAGLGVDSLSMGAPRILAAKASLGRHPMPACRELAARAVASADRSGVRETMRSFQAEAAKLPMLRADLVALDSDARSKAEVIKELTDLLALGGYVADAAAVEEAVWAREETYSTGFGHGFAVPHCKSDHVENNALAMVRLRTPVEWGSLDGAPVRVAILLAMRASDQGREHLRVFSQLSRLVMRDGFRAAIEEAAFPDDAFRLLHEHLAPPAPTPSPSRS